MTVPIDPYNFSNGTVADADQVDARFLPLYTALAGALAADNLAAALVQALFAPGDLKATALAAAPSGWLLCNGAAVSRIGANAALFAAIGTTYGVGDGTTTFNLPDLAGRVPMGVGTPAGAAGATAHTLAQKAGEETHVLTTAEIPAHVHAMGITTAAAPKTDTGATSTAAAGAQNTAVNTGGGGAHNNLPPYLGVNWLVKL